MRKRQRRPLPPTRKSNQMITLTDKEKSDLYYKLEAKDSELKEALRQTRDEPVLGLKSIANIIKKVLDKAEVESLIKELK